MKKGQNFLEMIPSISGKVRLTESEGLVTISFDRDSWIDKIFLFIFNRPQTINVELDETGTKVIKLVDGKRNIHEISEELKNSFEDGFEQHMHRTTMFISTLYKNKFVELKVAKS